MHGEVNERSRIVPDTFTGSLAFLPHGLSLGRTLLNKYHGFLL